MSAGRSSAATPGPAPAPRSDRRLIAHWPPLMSGAPRRDREVFVRPVTRGGEAPATWRAVWPVRLLGIVLLAGLIYLLFQVLVHIKIAGG